MLGTGASDGWPSAWCADECCSGLVQSGDLRTPTSALIDGTLLVDPGPESPRQALRQNISLATPITIIWTRRSCCTGAG